MRLATAMITTILAFGLCSGAAVGQTVSALEYWERADTLFSEFLQMEADGVFFDEAYIRFNKRLGFPIPNTIRGENPPGGYFGRPPGSEWLDRIQDFRDLDISGDDSGGECTSIPELIGGIDTVCGFELFNLYILTGESLAERNGFVSKFWLAKICRETPAACAPYVEE